MKDKLNTSLIRNWMESATRKSNDDLYPMVALGDTDAREKMIQSNMGLVISKVDHFLAFLPKFRHLRDDMISNGFIGLVEAVNKMAADGFIDGANPTGLMGICIQHRLGKTIESEETIRVPARTKKRKQGTKDQITVPQSVSFTDEAAEEEFSYDPRHMRDLRETLEACCENETELEILRLREEGYVDREIAERLGLPLTTTYVLRRTMYARFLDLSGWKGEA